MKNINDDRQKASLFSLRIIWKRIKLHDDLNALDDRLLKDIGIVREEIPAYVEKSYPLFSLREMLSQLTMKIVAMRSNQQAAMELSKFDDRILADMGLYRSDISSIAHGNYPERHTSVANDDHQRAA